MGKCSVLFLLHVAILLVIWNWSVIFVKADILVGARRLYQGESMKPISSALMTSLLNVKTLPACMKACSENGGCLTSTWVQSTTNCSLFSSKSSTEPLDDGEVAVVETSRTEIMKAVQGNVNVFFVKANKIKVPRALYVTGILFVEQDNILIILTIPQ